MSAASVAKAEVIVEEEELKAEEGADGLDSSRCWGCLPEDCDEAAVERWAQDAV